VEIIGQIWQVIAQLFRIVGGLGVFIFGMKVLSDGLQKAAGSRMQTILNSMTGTPLTAIGTGVAVTSFLQSSSATTVMVVSVVNAGLLSLTGAVGVIMGANIGTTLTAWIVSALGFKVSVSAFALPVIAIGLPMLLNSKSRHKGLAEALVGFGILFIGLGFLKEYLATDAMKDFIQAAVAGISVEAYVLRFPIFVLIGTVLTVLVQSSSAAMTITLTLISIGALTFEQGALIVLGENIGTTITAYLASLGANVNAKRASRVHILFNLIGVSWMFVAFTGFTWVVRRIIPDGAVIFGNENYLLFQLALFHTLFNITNTSVLAWFIPQLERAAVRLVKDDITGSEASLRVLSHGFQEISEAYVFEAREYLKKLFGRVEQMLGNFTDLMVENERPAGEVYQTQVEIENDIDELEEELAEFLAEISSRDMSPEHHNDINIMIRTVGELERIGDELLQASKVWKRWRKSASPRRIQNSGSFVRCSHRWGRC
jgi:phosphate:Na+ symporter